jgi:hypothetical protein
MRRRDAPGRSIRGSLLLPLAVVLAACGGGQKLDSGGFTESQRASLLTALDGIRKTDIQSSLASLGLTAASRPTACRIHMRAAGKPGYTLFVYWKPRVLEDQIAAIYFTFFSGVIGQVPGKDTFNVSYASARVSTAKMFQILLQHLPADYYARPVERCRVSLTGEVTLRDD